MPFSNIEDAEERSVLAVALEQYCSDNGINPLSEEYNRAREMLIILYHTHGKQTVAELKDALRQTIQSAR